MDVTGDGLADASYGPLECDQTCSAFAAPDVDGDGTDELLVQNVQFSIAGLKLFEVLAEGGTARIVPVTVAPPGTAAFGYQGFEGGAEPQFWLGGDAGDVRRDPLRALPGRPRARLDDERPFRSTRRRLGRRRDVVRPRGHRAARRRRATSSTWPVNDDVVPFLQTGGCGADLDPSS